jgi:hypothetical protein
MQRAVGEERERCARVVEESGPTLRWLADKIRQGPQSITADMPGIAFTQTITREEAKRRWPDKAAEIDAVPEITRIPDPSVVCTSCGFSFDQDGTVKTCPRCEAPGGGRAETLAEFGKRWDARKEGETPCGWCGRSIGVGEKHVPNGACEDCTVVADNDPEPGELSADVLAERARCAAIARSWTPASRVAGYIAKNIEAGE